MPPKNFKNLIGQRFGRLTVIERAESKNERTYWTCLCDCGNKKVISASNLVNSNTLSCGCLNHEKVLDRITKHGMTGTKVHRLWCHMKDRCLNPKNKSYKNYGGRGITVYPAWIDDFQAFYDYVSKLEHYGEESYTLDRIDNNGNYEPNNVRWADSKTQARNRRSNVIVEYNGEKMLLTDAAKKSGIKEKVLQKRVKRGDVGEKLFRDIETNCKPPIFYGERNRNSKLNANEVRQIRELYSTGEYSLKQLGEKFGVSDVSISNIVKYKTWAGI